MSTNHNKLAFKGTPGNWFYQDDSDVYTHIVRPVDNPGTIICHLGQDTSGEYEANAHLISAAPEAVEFIADLLEWMETTDYSIDEVREKVARAEEILKKAYNF